MRRQQYKDFDATELFCPRCRRSVPVRKRLLLVLSEGEKYDYICVYCGTSAGDKLVKDKEGGKIVLG
ncbi:MAG: cytoplasmic protein [Pseudomonadota bacterium]|nr:cytoplasmic protein [Pseudomonadota bacterium]